MTIEEALETYRSAAEAVRSAERAVLLRLADDPEEYVALRAFVEVGIAHVALQMTAHVIVGYQTQAGTEAFQDAVTKKAEEALSHVEKAERRLGKAS